MIPSSTAHPDRLALIGYDNLLITSTEAPEALTANTFERYKPAAGAVVAKFQLNALSPIDFIAIGAHNIDTEITLQYSLTVGGALITLDVFTPTDFSALMITFDQVQAFEIAITTNSEIEIAVVYAGKALQMQQPIYGGVSPIELAGDTEYQNNMSETGQFLGRNILQRGLMGSFSWQFLDDIWLRETFKPFMESAKRMPFFIKWRPDYYDSAVFGYTTRDIKPANMGGGSRLMTVSFEMRAHAE